MTTFTKQDIAIKTGEEALDYFNFYIELLSQNKIDAYKFEKEFFESFPDCKSTKAPLYLMFASFVGAIDALQMLLDFADKEKGLGAEQATETTK